jgi:geranylgeranyl pyrophosphate synthase
MDVCCILTVARYTTLCCTVAHCSVEMLLHSSFVLARKICCTIGEYFQVQDDVLDCFGDPEVIG